MRAVRLGNPRLPALYSLIPSSFPVPISAFRFPIFLPYPLHPTLCTLLSTPFPPMPYQTDELTGIRWTPCTNAGKAQIPGAAPVQVVGVTMVGQSAVYQVAEIGAGSYAAFNLRIAFNGPQPIDPGGYGDACTMGGAVQTLWDTGTPSPGDVWGIKPGQFSLTKGGVGSFVVDGIVDSGTNRMFGRWEGISSVLGKYAGSTLPLTPGSTDSFNVWYGAPGSEQVSFGLWIVMGTAVRTRRQDGIRMAAARRRRLVCDRKRAFGDHDRRCVGRKSHGWRRRSRLFGRVVRERRQPWQHDRRVFARESFHGCDEHSVSRNL